MTHKNQVRIISGLWRGRKLKFPDVAGLRPTQDSIRETLFNWLSPYIVDATCLDLFAGSGVMGFESLSRGAKAAVLVDQDHLVIAELKHNRQLLAAENAQIIQAKIPSDFFSLPQAPFDIVFIDPPFHQDLALKTMNWVCEKGLVKAGSLVYLETEIELADMQLPDCWHVLKKKQTSTLVYSLLELR